MTTRRAITRMTMTMSNSFVDAMTNLVVDGGGDFDNNSENKDNGSDYDDKENDYNNNENNDGCPT